MQQSFNFVSFVTDLGEQCQNILQQTKQTLSRTITIALNSFKVTKMTQFMFPKCLKINIEGNIGAGKSTVISHLQKQYPQMKIFPEAVDNWEHILCLVQNQPGRGFEYLLQNMISDDFIVARDAITRNATGGITERSIDACIDVFTSIYQDAGEKFINNYQFNQLNYKRKRFNIEYDACIYIKTSINTCLNRSSNRGRDCEAKMTLKFLQQIEDKYNSMIDRLLAEGKTVHVVDGEMSKQAVLTQVIDIIETLRTT